MHSEIKLRGRLIRTDENGLVSLNDIHRAAGFSKSQKPSDWMRLPSYAGDFEAVARRITGKSRNWTKDEMKSVAYTERGTFGGTWVHENLALAYAAYLSRELATEIREVFLRYKKADPTLADDVLSRATPEQIPLVSCPERPDRSLSLPAGPLWLLLHQANSGVTTGERRRRGNGRIISSDMRAYLVNKAQYPSCMVGNFAVRDRSQQGHKSSLIRPRLPRVPIDCRLVLQGG